MRSDHTDLPQLRLISILLLITKESSKFLHLKNCEGKKWTVMQIFT